MMSESAKRMKRSLVPSERRGVTGERRSMEQSQAKARWITLGFLVTLASLLVCLVVYLCMHWSPGAALALAAFFLFAVVGLMGYMAVCLSTIVLFLFTPLSQRTFRPPAPIGLRQFMQ